MTNPSDCLVRRVAYVLLLSSLRTDQGFGGDGDHGADAVHSHIENKKAGVSLEGHSGQKTSFTGTAINGAFGGVNQRSQGTLFRQQENVARLHISLTSISQAVRSRHPHCPPEERVGCGDLPDYSA